MFDQQIQELLNKAQELGELNREHVKICNVTFKRSDLKRAEEVVQDREGGGKVKITKVTWEDGKEQIFNISIQQFNEAFYK